MGVVGVDAAVEEEVEAPRRPGWSSLIDPAVLRWTGFLLLTRVAMVAAVAASLRGGVPDPSRDLIYHFQMAELPLNHLREPTLTQYPALLGMVEAATYRPLRLLDVSPATALRLGAVTWDVIAGWFLLATVSLVDRDRVARTAVIYTFVPLTWMTSAAFGQDEVIGAAFIAAALWCLALGRRAAARVVGVTGLFVAKLLVLPLLVSSVVARPRERWRAEAIAILGPVAVWVVLLWSTTGRDGLTNQLGYRPEWITFSVTPWGWLVEHDWIGSRTAHLVGQLLAAAAVVAVLAFMLRGSSAPSANQGDRPRPERVARLTAAQLLVAFGILAVTNPEYISLAAPALVLVGYRRRDVVWLLGVACIPWVTDTLFAVIRRGDIQRWPVVGEFTLERETRVLMSHIHLGLAVATSLILVGCGLRLARHREAGGQEPADDERATELDLRN